MTISILVLPLSSEKVTITRNSEFRITYKLIDVDGRETMTSGLSDLHGREARRRLENLRNVAWNDLSDADLTDLFRRWADQTLSQKGEGTKLEIYVQRFNLPSMADYREDKRPYWTIVATLRYQKSGLSLRTESKGSGNAPHSGRGTSLDSGHIPFP